MVVDHICVNFGAPLFQEFFLALNKFNIEQNVFYPRNSKHQTVDSDLPIRVDSPLVLNQLTRISYSRKRRILKQQYDPLFRRNKPDIIHAHTLFSDGSLALHYYGKYGTPYIVAIRATDLDHFLKYKPWLKSYGKQILDHARYVVFISASLKRKFQQIYGDGYESKTRLIPNGINQTFLNTGKLLKKNIHTPLDLLYVGSFLKRKNVPSLIKLVENSNARLSIVGRGGDEEKKVLQMIRNSDKINYLGQIKDQSRLIQIYRQSDIFIMTSLAETFGLVYIEAMSQGLPVIYSKNTGIDGLFEQGSIGFGVSPGSVSEMKYGIDRIVSNYQEISESCFSKARTFNWANIAEKYSDMYGRILS